MDEDVDGLSYFSGFMGNAILRARVMVNIKFAVSEHFLSQDLC